MYSTQQHIPILAIKENLVILKDGSVSLVITTSAVNFGLLFETEQEAIIGSFAGLLNSLSFPIQILIQSKSLDVSNYLTFIDKAVAKQANPLLRDMTLKYRQFVDDMIKQRDASDKQFYIAINVSSLELGFLSKDMAETVKKASIILMPRRDHLLRQFSRIGLKARQLTSPELITLYYNIYNPVIYDNKPSPTIKPPAPASATPKASSSPPPPAGSLGEAGGPHGQAAPQYQNFNATPNFIPQPINQAVKPSVNLPQSIINQTQPPPINPNQFAHTGSLPLNPTPIRMPAYPTGNIQSVTYPTRTTPPFVVEELTDEPKS